MSAMVAAKSGYSQLCVCSHSESRLSSHLVECRIHAASGLASASSLFWLLYRRFTSPPQRREKLSKIDLLSRTSATPRKMWNVCAAFSVLNFSACPAGLVARSLMKSSRIFMSHRVSPWTSAMSASRYLNDTLRWERRQMAAAIALYKAEMAEDCGGPSPGADELLDAGVRARVVINANLIGSSPVCTKSSWIMRRTY
jgi:hypothetical protein